MIVEAIEFWCSCKYDFLLTAIKQVCYVAIIASA
jgi:hypothetical protein